MKLSVRLFLLAAAVPLGIWAWGFFFPDPQKVIESRLVKLSQLASFAPGDGNFKSLASTERMESLFAENVQVTVDLPGEGRHTFEQRDELMQAAMASRSLVNGVKVKFDDISVMVNPDKESAVADATLDARVGAEKDLIVQPLKFTFKKFDGDWLITRLETVKTLR